MVTNCKYISYSETGYFSKLVLDYIDGDDKLRSFYNHPVSIEGVQAAIEARKLFNTPRTLLVAELTKQYDGIDLTPFQEDNLQSLLLDNTFTVCTAHQPNIFTGHLYFIYKIIHVIRLADHLKEALPGNNFVPIYYMGSEDADLDELGHINLSGQKLEWQTKQTGAVGRMKVDENLVKMIERIASQLGVLPHGTELINILKDAYKEGTSIQQATLILVNKLFNQFGLLIVIPDNAELKRSFDKVVIKELTETFSFPLVEETLKDLRKNYKAQASGRELNLFYLFNNKRERILKVDGQFKVEGLGLEWSEAEILAEVDLHPEHFSANVILRGVFQEMILPNIAFIGGGGEIAYWLELKKVFEACAVPYPMLVVRNSFMQINEKHKLLIDKLSFEINDTFKPLQQLTTLVVKRDTDLKLDLVQEKVQMNDYYRHLEEICSDIDPTLAAHVCALHSKALAKISTLEKKMLKLETRKFTVQQQQIAKLKEALFPGSDLQERVDNFLIYYAEHGQDWLNKLYEASTALEQKFCVLSVEG